MRTQRQGSHCSGETHAETRGVQRRGEEFVMDTGVSPYTIMNGHQKRRAHDGLGDLLPCTDLEFFSALACRRERVAFCWLAAMVETQAALAAAPIIVDENRRFFRLQRAYRLLEQAAERRRREDAARVALGPRQPAGPPPDYLLELWRGRGRADWEAGWRPRRPRQDR